MLPVLLLLLLLLSDDDVSRIRRRTTNIRPASFGTNSSECTQNRSRRPGNRSQRVSYTSQHFHRIDRRRTSPHTYIYHHYQLDFVHVTKPQNYSLQLQTVL